MEIVFLTLPNFRLCTNFFHQYLQISSNTDHLVMILLVRHTTSVKMFPLSSWDSIYCKVWTNTSDTVTVRHVCHKVRKLPQNQNNVQQLHQLLHYLSQWQAFTLKEHPNLTQNPQQTQMVHLLKWHASVSINPSNTKHLYNIYTMLDQRRRHWADIV